jgi:hypothetical protein
MGGNERGNFTPALGDKFHPWGPGVKLRMGLCLSALIIIVRSFDVRVKRYYQRD